MRLARRVLAVGAVAVGGYFSVTVAQVWAASRHDDAPRSDAIVVLGAAQYDGRPSPVLKARLDHAATLFTRDVADVVVVTGGRRPGDRSTEAAASADYLARVHGIPQERILREVAGRNSWQSLASAANELRKRGRREVVLVTDPFHAARVAAIAEELRLEAHVSPTRSSPISGGRELRHLFRESLAVAAGRIVGFRRLVGIDRAVREVDRPVEGSSPRGRRSTPAAAALR